MKAGFGLLEVVISIAISSVLSLALFTILFQLQKSEQRTSQIISTDMRLVLITERLQKDFAGMFWPQFMPKKQLKSKKSDASVQSDQIKLPEKIQEQTQDHEILGPNIAKIIYSENNLAGDLTVLKECSFITLNPLQVYGRAGARIARVIYSLVPQTGQIDSFVLNRQESPDLDYNLAKQQAPSYALIDGIRSLNLTYFYQDQQNNLDEHRDLSLDQTSNNNQELNLNIGAQNNTNLLNRVPNYIKLDLSLWLNTEEFEQFEFWFVLNNLVDEPDNNTAQANDPDDDFVAGQAKNKEKSADKNRQKTSSPKSEAKQI